MKKYSVIFICFNANVQGRSVIITFIAFLFLLCINVCLHFV